MAVRNGLRASISVGLLMGAIMMAAGCGSGVNYTGRTAPPPPITKIKIGMTEAELIAVLGEPTKRGVFIVYPNDPVRTANKEQMLYWDTPRTGKIDVLMKAGKMHSKISKN